MKLTIIHDIHGNIEALVVSPPDFPPVQLETQPGQRMTEIEAPPELTLDFGGPRLNENLSELVEYYRVEIPEYPSEGRLTRKA